MKKFLIILCLFVTAACLMNTALAETYYMKYNMQVYDYPSAAANKVGVIPQKNVIMLKGWTNDNWREVSATVNGETVYGWIYSPSRDDWSSVELDNESVWSQYTSDQSLHDASGYDMSRHMLQIVEYGDGRCVSSSGGLLGTTDLGWMAAPKANKPVTLYAKNSFSSGSVYTLRGDEVVKALRYAADYSVSSGGFYYVITENGTYGFVHSSEVTRSIECRTYYDRIETWYAAEGGTALYTYPSAAFGVSNVFSQGTAVELNGEYNDEWVHGEIAGTTSHGWIKRSSLTKEKTTVTGGTTAYIVEKDYSDSVHMLTSPSEDGKGTKMLYAGTRVTVVSQENGWSYCYVDGYAGYIRNDWLTTQAPEVETITMPQGTLMYPKEDVRLYKEASESASVWGTVAKGTKLNIYYTRGSWASTMAVIDGSVHTGYVKLSQLMTLKEYLEGPGFFDALEGEGYVVQTQSGRLHLRAMPDTTGKSLGLYESGTIVIVHSKKNGWAYVTAEGKTGYMMLKYLQPYRTAPETPPESAAVQKTVQTGNDGRLHLRASASADAKSLGLYENGTIVTVHSMKNGWAYVTAGGETGYMMTKFLTDAVPAPEKPGTDAPAVDTPETQAPAQSENGATVMYVQTGNDGRLHLRASASAGAKSLGLYENGTQVTVHSEKNGWVFVTAGGQTGYMKKSFLTINAPAVPPAADNVPPAQENAAGTVYYVKTGNDGRLHLRASKSTLARSLGLFENGTAVTVYEKSGSWVRVKVNGLTGYMKHEFLSITP